MSTENGSTAHKGSYINGLKRCFQHGLEECIAERDQNKDDLGNTYCLGKQKVYLLIQTRFYLRNESPEVSLSVSCSYQHVL